MPLYYSYWYRLSHLDLYLIWYSYDSDGVFIDSEGFVPSFHSMDALQTFADNQGILLEEPDHILLDLDVLKRWLSAPKTSAVNCVEFLNAWNLFVDVARSINNSAASNFLKSDKSGNKVYDKLFWGNNLPSVSPEGRSYVPLWTNEQITQVHEILANGLNMFEKSILVYS